ncbi:MAG: Hpt domain-containing protein [Woeseiaceae bacterium]
MSESIQQAFLVVSHELNKTVNQARVVLEDAVEGRNTRQALERCATHLHEAGGVMKVVGVYGGALLTEEMEHVCRFMLQRGQDKKTLSDCLEALTRAMVQLPAYLERLLAGGRDIALVLLPMLNDLRAVRGQALLSESTILLLNRSPQATVTLAQRGSDPSEDFIVLSRKIRPAFQLALLGLLKADSETAKPHLTKLQNMALAFEKAAARDDVYRLWWVVGGVVEALLSGSLELSVSVKRLLGQADRRIKKVIDSGLEIFDKEPVEELLNSLLYYIARVDPAGPRVLSIREAFSLTDVLPAEAQVESAREELAAPSVALMETVAAAIRDDLASVKDVLDIHVRTEEQDVTKLAPQVELLRKISDTLGVLGLGELRGSVVAEIDRLKAFVANDPSANSPETLLAIASTLLHVESTMEQRLTQLVQPKTQSEASAANEAIAPDMQEVRKAVIRECIVNLARIKDTLAQTMAGKIDRAAIDATPKLVDGILSGLNMLELDKAVDVFGRLGRFFDAYFNSANFTLASEHQDRLADALVSIEYYMETIEAGRQEPAYMLDNAQTCMGILDKVRDGMLAVASGDAVAEDTLVTRAATMEDQATHSRTATIADETEVISSPVVSEADTKIDPELLELFIEEAKEEVATVRKLLPSWQGDTSDVDSLITVRRSFHTLKGSGRMVGAERIGEYCWHIEDLLNRVINRTLSITPAMVGFVGEAAGAVPELIEQLEVGIEPKVDIDLLTAKAIAFAEGDPSAGELSRESVAMSQSALEMDPVLHEIFSKEAGGHLATIEQFLARIEPGTYPVSVTEALHRACHTLHGSVNTASVERAVPLSGALNQFIRRLFDSDAGLDREATELIGRSAGMLTRMIAAINDPDAEAIDPQPLITALQTKMDAVVHSQTSLLDGADAPDSVAYEPTEVLTSVTKPGDIHGPALTDSPDYDPDIGDIFVEESGEVLEAVDIALQGWVESRDGQALDELKRLLHTLKGSANMAGISAFGNLSHELEALLNALADDRVQSDDAIDGLLRDSFDVLHQMRDQVVSGFQPRQEAAVEDRVRAAAAGQSFASLPKRGFSEAEMVEIPSLDTSTDRVDANLVDEDDDPVLDVGDFFGGTTDQTFAKPQSPSLDIELPGEEIETVAFTAPPAEASEDADQPTSSDEAPVVSDDDDDFEKTLVIDAEETVSTEPPATPFDESMAHEMFFDSDNDNADDAAPIEVEASADDHVDTIVVGTEHAPEVADDEDNVLRVERPEWQREEDSSSSDADDSADLLLEQSQILEALIDDAAASFAGDEFSDAPADVTESLDDFSETLASDDQDVEPAEVIETDSDTAAEVAQASDETAPVVISDENVATDADDEPDNVVSLPSDALPSSEQTREKTEFARVDSKVLEDMLNAAGEISIYHGRLAQQVSSIEFHLAELDQTVTRLRDQLRQMDMETEAQILTRHESERTRDDFDPLELDRYSTIQQLSRALGETSNDVDSLRGLLKSVTGEADSLLTQQARVTAELQGGLMRTRMVPFDRHVARLARLVRQAANDTGKQAELAVEGASGELDRQVLEKMLPPLEHMMRNAVVHGIEPIATRQAQAKSPTGQITIRLHREGSEMVIDVADDGGGLDVDAIRKKGIDRGFIKPGDDASDEAVMELILEPGFSTAEQLTQAAGRGVGMDVVANEVKRLGGSLHISSLPGQGTNFTIRLPFTLAITQALVVRAGDEVFALPLPTVEGVTRLPRATVDQLLAAPDQMFDYGEHSYHLKHLGPLIGSSKGQLSEDDQSAVSVILVRAGVNSTALLVDEMLTSREIVVKSVGPQIAAIQGVSGATILGDGSVVLILDTPSLVRSTNRPLPIAEVTEEFVKQPLIMVVDDSITVRRVTERFLLRNDFRVVTAKDGMDAVSVIQEQQPDLILLDIEMPRMDGFEFATHVRNDSRFAEIPIIMITSRTGEKHKARAIEIGVNDYLGKPYQDRELLQAMTSQLTGPERLS